MKKLLLLSLLFITQPVFAEYITNDIVSGCDDMYFYRAVFIPHNETCANGYYLPANALYCEICPSGYTCNGGTYGFNPDIFQGAEYSSNITSNMNNICASNAPAFLRAVFQPKRIICSAGYYLPANIDECRKCLNDHYCPGGQLTFNETTPQGIIECPTEHPFAPAGMWLASQCGRKLHVGNDVVYMHQNPANPTTHRLFVQYGNTVYSANAVPKQIGVIDPKMSANATSGLHVIITDIVEETPVEQEYLICDDSVSECRND